VDIKVEGKKIVDRNTAGIPTVRSALNFFVNIILISEALFHNLSFATIFQRIGYVYLICGLSRILFTK